MQERQVSRGATLKFSPDKTEINRRPYEGEGFIPILYSHYLYLKVGYSQKNIDIISIAQKMCCVFLSFVF